MCKKRVAIFFYGVVRRTFLGVRLERIIEKLYIQRIVIGEKLIAEFRWILVGLSDFNFDVFEQIKFHEFGLSTEEPFYKTIRVYFKQQIKPSGKRF